MQVTARVLPAGASWSGVGEARAAARQLLEQRAAGPTVRRASLLRTSAELRTDGEHRRLLVTVQYPHN